MCRIFQNYQFDHKCSVWFIPMFSGFQSEVDQPGVYFMNSVEKKVIPSHSQKIIYHTSF